MASSTLDIKIKALVEGLKEVAALGEQFAKTAKDAEKMEGIGDPLEGLGEKAKKAGTEIDKAFASLGGKSTQQIKDQMEQIRQALEKVKQSGASFDEVSRATQLAESKLRSLNSELQNPAPKGFGDSLSSIKTKLGSLDFKGATGEANQLMGSFSGILGVVKPLALAFLGLAGLKSLGALVKDSADLAAKVETLGVTMQVVGRNAGYSAEEMTKQESSLKKLGITTEVARDSLTKMIQAGIRVNEVGTAIDATGTRMTKAQELARAAQDLAVVTGENSSDTLKRLVTNIQQMDTMGLRFMGLTVSREAAEAKFAAQIGKTADALSESQKKQAFFNATMAEAGKLSGAYVDALETVSKKLGSLKRYQDEFTLSLGNNFVPAYGALVDAVTNYLAEGQKLVEHFEKTSSTGSNLKDGVKALATSFSDTLLNATPGALGAMEAFSRAFKAIGELVGPIIRGIGEFIPPVLAFLTGFFDGLATIAAVIQDAVMIAFGVLAEGFGVVTLGIGSLLTGVGKLVGVFNTDLGRSIQEAGQSLKEAGRNMVGFGSEAVDTALSAKGAVGQLATSFNEVNTESGKTKENVRAFSKEINDLAKAQSEGKISAEELNSKFESLSERLISTRKEGGLTGKEFSDLGRQLQSVPGTLVKAFEEAAAGAQVSFSSITSSISKESAAGAAFMEASINLAATKSKAMFEAMGTDATKFGSDLLATFSKYASGAKSIEDLIVLDKQLQEARKQGLISETQLQSGLDLSTKKFGELLESQLKSARTREDFDKLRESVNEMGDAGKLSGTAMEQAFNKIAEAASGATGKVKELADAQSRLTIADASLAAAQAHFNMVKAESDVMKGRVELWKAENELAREGSQINQLKAESARMGLRLAQEELVLSRLRYAEQVANMDLVIVKQRELNATKALENDRNNEALQKEQAAARELGVQHQLNITTIREQVSAQQENMLKIQEAKLMVDSQVEVMKARAEEEKKGIRVSENFRDAQGESKTAVEAVKTSVDSVGTSLGGVRSAQDDVQKGYQGMSSASEAWATAATAAAIRVAKANADAVASGTRADVTGKFVGGNGSITNPETGKTTNLPKDTGVPSGGSKGRDGFTGAGWRPAGGVKGVDGTVSQGQVSAANAQVAENAKKYARAGQSSDSAAEGTRSRNNMAAVDASGPFVAWDKYSRGSLTEADKALVQGSYTASKNNFLMMQANPHAFSFAGKDDATMWYNRTRTMMASLGLPALATGTNYVPKDMIAQIHEGEAVVPKAYNPAAGGGDWSSIMSMLTGGAGKAFESVQSIAQAKFSGQGEGADIVKKIEVELKGAGESVRAILDSTDEGALLRILEQAKKVH